ncbi:MAG: hypothetical protein QOD39_349 [Mycobacterium sp.]|jgi:hypothetical protein|nr:hypothetical protein [Mycobacterium sp.]
MPAAELDELAAIYEGQGRLSADRRASRRRGDAHDAPAAPVDVELPLDPDDLANPL